jgi:hypothetical protein
MLADAYKRAVALVTTDRLGIDLVATTLVLHRGLTHKDLVELDGFARQDPTRSAAFCKANQDKVGRPT